MTKEYADDEILKRVADSIIEDFKKADETYTPEQEAQFRMFVAGLVDAEPPEDDDLWQTIEILRRAIEGKDKENARRAVTTFMLQFISGCEPSQGHSNYCRCLFMQGKLLRLTVLTRQESF